MDLGLHAIFVCKLRLHSAQQHGLRSGLIWTCLSSGIDQVLATAFLRWATVSKARDISRVIIEPVSTRKMYSILGPDASLLSYHRGVMWQIGSENISLVVPCGVFERHLWTN